MIIKDKQNKKTKPAVVESQSEYIEMAEPKLGETLLDKAVKLSVIAGIVMISFSIFNYFTLFKPKLEEDRLNKQNHIELALIKQESQNVIKTKEIEIEQKEAEISKLNEEKLLQLAKIQNIKDCLSEAEQSYHENRAQVCKKHGLDTWDEDCTLPGYYSSKAEKRRIEDREVCLKLYGGDVLPTN